MRRRLYTLAAVIAIGCAVVLAGMLMLLVASTRGDCALTFGRVAFTGRDGLLYTWVYRDDTPWTVPDAYFREFTQPTIKWWSFDAGWHRVGWTPVKSVYFVLMPIWVPAMAVATVGLACAWYWRRVRRLRVTGKCPACGYSLVGLAAGAVCPECGNATTSSGR
ncbi:MAG: hypothetical protein ACREJO_11590 [Phycisphaerales bacterium]